MTTRRGIIMPPIPFASQADRDRTLLVMCPIMTECVPVRQIARIRPENRDEV